MSTEQKTEDPSNEVLTADLGRFRRLLYKYMHESRLQTFEDRERFREDARLALEASDHD